jgi:hypothetical protein
MPGPTERLRLPMMLLRRGGLALMVLTALLMGAGATPAQAATITVTTTVEEAANNGTCSLIEAIENAHNDAATYTDCVAGSGIGVDTIAFNIPTIPGVQCSPTCTITPTFAYTVDRPVTIDGYSQPGAIPNTLAVGNNAVLKIELNGQLAPGNGLNLGGGGGGGVTLRGLIVNRYASGNAVNVDGGSNHRIVGNFIGTDASGTIARSNDSGVLLYNSTTGATVGGTIPDERNVVSGNLGFGVIVISSSDNRIEGNHIGTSASGVAPLGNKRSGVYVDNSGNTAVGGAAPGAGNTIAFNGSTISPDGVRMFGGSRNAILGNRIFSNVGLGINLLKDGLGGDGVTPNDVGDGDGGPNRLQNFPVLTSASVGTGTSVDGTLNSTLNSSFRIELFASPACDALGNGQGQTFLGFTDATTDVSGNAGFAASLPAVPAGQVIAATATSLATADTSEFSTCVTVQQAGITVSSASGPTTEAAGGTFDASFTVRLATAPTSDVTLALSVSDPTEGAIVGPSTLTFTPANATTPLTVSLVGVDDTVDDGDVAYAIVLAAATSSDAAYAGLKPADVAVTNADDDAAGSLQFTAAASTVPENGGSATVTVSRAGGLAGGVTV